MRNVSSWLRQAGVNFANSIQRFMMGRYGHDRLNVALLIVGVILAYRGKSLLTVSVAASAAVMVTEWIMAF